MGYKIFRCAKCNWKRLMPDDFQWSVCKDCNEPMDLLRHIDGVLFISGEELL